MTRWIRLTTQGLVVFSVATSTVQTTRTALMTESQANKTSSISSEDFQRSLQVGNTITRSWIMTATTISTFNLGSSLRGSRAFVNFSNKSCSRRCFYLIVCLFGFASVHLYTFANLSSLNFLSNHIQYVRHLPDLLSRVSCDFLR